MNTQLVNSLVQIIESAGVCGGQPRIRNTRIPVWTLVAFRKQGADDEELLRNYPTLTPSNLSAAWAYYEQHREEGDRAITALDEDGDD